MRSAMHGDGINFIAQELPARKAPAIRRAKGTNIAPAANKLFPQGGFGRHKESTPDLISPSRMINQPDPFKSGILGMPLNGHT